MAQDLKTPKMHLKRRRCPILVLRMLGFFLRKFGRFRHFCSDNLIFQVFLLVMMVFLMWFACFLCPDFEFGGVNLLWKLIFWIFS